MREECSGINYALRFGERTLEVRARSPRKDYFVIELASMRSIEISRKSVMPPAAIGLAALSIGLVFRLFGDAFLALIPLGSQIVLQVLSLGLAAGCLIVLLVRWLFANLVLKPEGQPPTVVRLVPTGSARAFMIRFRKKLPIGENAPGEARHAT